MSYYFGDDEDDDMPRGSYDVAQVCPNGHTATSSAIDFPAHRKDFCPECGERTIMECPSCNRPIRGYYREHVTARPFIPPAFCSECGAAFPWTEMRKRIALELFAEQMQDEADRRLFEESVDEVVRNTAQAPLAASRLRRLLVKAGKETTGMIRDVLVDALSEAVKKTIFSGP